MVYINKRFTKHIIEESRVEGEGVREGINLQLRNFRPLSLEPEFQPIVAKNDKP